MNVKYKKEYANLVYDILKDGSSLADLATIFKVTRKTIDNWRKKNEEFNVAVEIGLNAGESHIGRLIKKQGVEGNFNALKFYAQTIYRDAFRDPAKEVHQKIETNVVPDVKVVIKK